MQASVHDSPWRLLYRVASLSALVSAILIPLHIVVFLASAPPIDGSAVEWFALFRERPVAGLIDLDLLLACVNALLVPILLALYVALRRGRESAMALAAAFGLISAVLYVASNPALQMAALSDQYAAANTDAQRVSVTGAAEAILATWQGTGFHAAYLLGSIGGVLIGVAMVRSPAFSTVTGWLAIVGNTVALGLYLPKVGVYVSVFSVLFLEIWYLLIARRLARLPQHQAR